MKNKMKIIENETYKICSSKDYNFVFNKNNGVFARWGSTTEEDPAYSPFGPEILDLEISTGECLGNCKFCYKCNGSGVKTENMTLEQFKVLLDKIPKTLTQIAFGITNINTNPYFFPMMEYARSKNIIPNYTCHGLDMTPEIAKKTAKLCGAVAVSIVNKGKTYDAIKMFTDAEMNQVNIHYMLSEETYARAFDIMCDIKEDPRLVKMNAIVFLQYKPKGRNPDAFHAISSIDKYRTLVDYANEHNIKIGFDSCSAPLYFQSVKENLDKDNLIRFAEPCEAFGMFSSYINCKGEYFPCSFAENEGDWSEGLDVLGCDDFLTDIWQSDKLIKWRDIIINSSQDCKCEFTKVCRSCPIFDITTCKKSLINIGDEYEN